MNVITGLRDVADSLGLSTAALLAHKLDLTSAGITAAAAKCVPMMDRANERRDKSKRLDAKGVKDAASAFVTSALAAQLAPVERVSNENFLFVPGRTGDRAPLLPVQQRTVLGQTSLEWQVVGMAGEARNVNPSGLESLTYVGLSEDKKYQPVGHYGVRLSYDIFEMAQGDLLGRNIPSEKNTAAMQAMAEKMEREGGFGDLDRERPGFFNGGVAEVINLAVSFGDPAMTFDQMMIQLSIIDIMWSRSNPTRSMSGICMPKTHRLRLLRLFKDNNGSDTNAWLFALEAFPWLGNIIEDDRLLDGSSSNGPMWQGWSADSEELYYESSPAPTLFGPFEFKPLTTEFIALAQTGGIVNKRAERIQRYEMPAPA
jgi:hypothetical protein